MDAKLTLKFDEKIIWKAKSFAKKTNQSLSRIVENYFKKVTESDNETEDYPPLIKELSGIIKTKKEINIKEDYSNYLIKKYK
jgi:hypothetical protein